MAWITNPKTGAQQLPLQSQQKASTERDGGRAIRGAGITREREVERVIEKERTNAVAQQADKLLERGREWGQGRVRQAMSRDATESEAFIYDLISCTFDITIAVNASSF